MAANPFQYAVSQVQKKAQELFNQSPYVQGAQMYGRMAQSKPVQNFVQQATRQVAQQPIYNIPNSPTYGQVGNIAKNYATNRVLKPIVQASFDYNNPKSTNLQKGMAFAQAGVGVFNATPGGLGYNAVVQGGAGELEAFRNKTNLSKGYAKGLTNETSLGSQGLGIKNPILAGAVDVVAGLRSFDPIPSGGFGVAALGANVKTSNRYNAPLQEALRSVRSNPDVMNPSWNKMLEFAKRELTPKELTKYQRLNSRGKLGFLNRIEQRFGNELKAFHKEQGVAYSDIKLPKQLPKVNLKNIENPAKFDNPKNITKYDREAINWLKAHPEELNKPIEVGVYGKADKMGNLTHFIENGQHRYQALKELGVEDIPVVVRNPSLPKELEGLGVKELGNKGNFSYRANDSVKPTFVSVIDDTGKTVGKLHLSPDTVGGRKVLHIDGIEVSPKFRNQGIGTELLRKAEDAIKGTEYEGILARHETITNKKEIPTIFKKLGYQDVGEGLGLGKFFNQSKGLQSADLSIKLPKQLPKELEGLAAEARKYKSAEEFVKATNPNNKQLLPSDRPTIYKGDIEGISPKVKPYKKIGNIELIDEGQGGIYAKIDGEDAGYINKLSDSDTDLSVAVEFQKKGLGKILTREFLERYPEMLYNTGGFTPAGKATYKSVLTDIFNQSKGVQNADLSFKLPEYKPPVAPQVVNGKIKMKPIEGPRLAGMGEPIVAQSPRVLDTQSQAPLESALNKSIPELQPKTQLLNKIDQLKQSAQESIQEQKAIAQTKAQQLEGLSVNDLKDLTSLRKMVGSKAGQAGDIETLHAKNPKLIDRVLNRMREVTGDYQGNAKTDVELLDHALSLPTKGSIKIQQPPELKQIKALKEDAAIARDLVYHAEPIKRPQSKADLFDKDLKEWSDMVYKDAVASEKSKTIDAINKLTSSIEGSTNKSLRNKYVANKAGKIVTNKTGSAVENILLEGSPTWKDKPKILYIRETMDRNFEDVMGRDAPKMKETFLDPIKTSEAERIRFLNQERQSIKDLGIKARSKESGLVQQFGEKKLTAKQVLEQVGGDRKKADQIVNASNVLRQKYDTYLTDINKVLIRNGYDPIPKREDYFTHFQEVNSALERFGIPIRDNKLPTDINGLTADFKPGKNFFSNALPRLGDKTDIDAITGIDRYLEGASQQMYHTDNIQRLRLLENAIRAKFEGTTHLSNFVTELSEYANGIAGKKAMIDRAAEAMVGRNIYGAANRLKSQVGANMVGANVSSALTNFIPITQSLATTNKKSFVKGMMGTIGNVFKNDGFVDRSDFLTKRFGSDRLSMNLWDKTADKAGWFFKAIDHFTSSTIVRSKFDEGIKMGLSPSSAMKRADTWADKVLAGRSVGDMPTLFNSKTLGLLTQFQLEVNNQISFMAKDIPRNFDKKGAAAALGQLFLYSYLFNNLYEKATGRRPAFDPLGVAMQSYEDFTNPDLKANQAAKNTFSRVAQNLPFTSIVEGGRIPLGGALPDVAALIKGETDLGTELKKPLYYLLPPTGGGQIKKAVEGVSAYNQGYSESKAGRVRFPVKQDMGSLAKSALFGQWSSEEAQKYLREGASPLGDKQSNNYKALSPSERQSYMDSIQTGRAQDRQLERQKEEYEKTGNATPSNVKVLNDDVIKANLKYSKGNIYTTKDALYIKRPDTSVNKIALTNELTGNAIQQAKQLSAREGAIKSAGVAIYNRTDIPEWEKNEAYKALGTNAQEVEFKALASLPDDKQASVLYNLLKDRKWKQEKVDAFIKSDVLTNSVVGKMEDQGLINESQAKDLKAYIKSTSIKLGKVSAGSGKKAKKIKMPKLKTIKVKYSKLKIKIPKPKKYKALLSKGKSNKYFK